MNPLIKSLSNHVLEAKLRRMIHLDPLWQEKLYHLDGLRLKLILADIGFKRVFQFGPTDLHLAAPFAEADITLTTRSLHLLKLQEAEQTKQAFEDGHFYLIGNSQRFEELLMYIRSLHLDWETALAQLLPNPMAYHICSLAKMATQSIQQTNRTLVNSYRFWRDNEFHGKNQ